MEIAEVRVAKEQLEIELLDIVREKMSLFRTRTGLSPQRISIRLVEVKTLGVKETEHVPVSVDVEIRL